MGLRLDKQRAQRLQIIENTLALTRELGVDAVRVRDIRGRCGISDATFFNYFASRDAVLGEWAHDRVDAALERASARLAGGEPLRRAVRALADELAAEAVAERALLGRALSLIVTREPVHAEPGRRTHDRGRIDRTVALHRWLDASRAQGEIRGDVAPELAAGLLRAAVVTALVQGLADQVASARDLAARIRAALDVVLDGLRKRHERVRPADVRSTPRASPRPPPSTLASPPQSGPVS